MSHVLGHRRRENEDCSDRSHLYNIVHPPLQAAIPVIRQRERLPEKETAQAAYPGGGGVECCQICLPTQAFYAVVVFPVILVIDEGAEVNPITLAQMLEQMIGADLVSLVGRIGYPVCEIKKFLHRPSRDFSRYGDQ